MCWPRATREMGVALLQVTAHPITRLPSIALYVDFGTAAWSLSYLVLEQFSLGLQRSLRLPRSGLSLALSGATATTAVLYGTEHFFLSDEESELD